MRLQNYSGFEFLLRVEEKSPARMLLSEVIYWAETVDSLLICKEFWIRKQDCQYWKSCLEKVPVYCPVWILGMFNPSPATTLVIPIKAGSMKKF